MRRTLVAIAVVFLCAACTDVSSHEPAVPNPSLSRVNVAVLYERLHDCRPKRSIEDQIQILKETKAEFVFRCWWRWNPYPNSCDDLESPLKEECIEKRYSYEYLEEVAAEIKKEIPAIILCGSVPAQRLHREDWNPLTTETFNYPETWDMALDPAKFGISVEKKQIQCEFARTQFWVPQDMDWHDYDPEHVEAYLPDITNSDFQELLLSWAKKQIDCGVDAIWIDMLWENAKWLSMASGDVNHSGVVACMESANQIVENIREYGASRRKVICVGSWCPPNPYTASLDFVTATPSPQEVALMEMSDAKWDPLIERIREAVGEVPIFAFFDWWGADNSPLALFSQQLSIQEQNDFLEDVDEFLQSKDVVFVYPVHGGDIGQNPTKLAYGEYGWYDSLAPEFDTYDTIKQLAASSKK